MCRSATPPIGVRSSGTTVQDADSRIRTSRHRSSLCAKPTGGSARHSQRTQARCSGQAGCHDHPRCAPRAEDSPRGWPRGGRRQGDQEPDGPGNVSIAGRELLDPTLVDGIEVDGFDVIDSGPPHVQDAWVCALVAASLFAGRPTTSARRASCGTDPARRGHRGKGRVDPPAEAARRRLTETCATKREVGRGSGWPLHGSSSSRTQDAIAQGEFASRRRPSPTKSARSTLFPS